MLVDCRCVSLPKLYGGEIPTPIVFFPPKMSIEEASQYEKPFEFVRAMVYPDYGDTRKRWWIHERPRPKLVNTLAQVNRYFATVRHSKHRIFVWLDSLILPDSAIGAFARIDDYSFGLLHSRIHEVWSPAQGTQVRDRESGFRYTPTTCFETFPFPTPTDAQRDAFAQAAKELDTLRNNWLNPPEWTKQEILEFPGSLAGPWARYVHDTDARGIGMVRYPRLVARDDKVAVELKKRTLTNLYNQRPTWLDLAHKKLDAAVFAAYGWDPSMSDDEILANLLQLNLERAK